MLKHIKPHTHAFLFFLGGLFLMLVGPSLIQFSSAATISTTESIVYNYNPDYSQEKSVLLYAPNAKSNTFTLNLNQLGIDNAKVQTAMLNRMTLKNNLLNYTLKAYTPKSNIVRLSF